MQLRAIKDHVIVTDMNFEERVSKGGIVLMSDDGKVEGVRPRWGQVYAIGPEQKDVAIGDWVLVKHGRWTRGVNITEDNGTEKTVRRIDNDDILLVSDQPYSDV